MASANSQISVVQLGKRTKKILEWIEAYSKLVDKDIEYFTKSIAQGPPFDTETGKFTFTYPPRKRKEFRQLSDKYHEGVENLIKKL